MTFASAPPLRRFEPNPHDAILLHYVNYGYDPRGIPLWLPRVLRYLKSSRPLLTIFHELYARGSWRQSAFWLRPLQMWLARSIARLSDRAMVSSELSRDQLLQLAPEDARHGPSRYLKLRRARARAGGNRKAGSASLDHLRPRRTAQALAAILLKNRGPN
jgi:hypothetical protein